MLIYHASYCAIPQPEIRVSQYAKDFGPGVYCTSILAQAKRWAQRFPTPTINVYNYQEDSSLDILKFEQMTEQWLDFIIACRGWVEHHHDIVIGSMADDQIYNYIEQYLNGTISREQFWVLAKFKHPTHQICFCTQRALQCMTFQSTCPE